jgi:hypothetical protein
MHSFKYGAKLSALVFACLVFACLGPNLSFGADGSSIAIFPAPRSIHPGTPMVLDPLTSTFEFDLAGSDTRKLQLQLSHPLLLEGGDGFHTSEADSYLLGLDATLKMPLSKSLALRGGVEQVLGYSQFQSLGSIHCLNGTLRPDSYTASGCRFVTDGTSGFDRRTLNLGLGHEAGNFATSVNWFTTEANFGGTAVRAPNQYGPSPLLDNRLLNPLSGETLPGAHSSRDSLAGETTGIDLNFEVGFTTDQSGEIHLGLALTRILDANYQGIYSNSVGPMDWNSAAPFNSATAGIEWTHGAFSSGIRGYYREPVTFLNRENLDALSTFDVHFTWRTPWNANLSVGASNILGSGVDEVNGNDKSADRFESIYGRIPYVRYQQDL